ncbi:MAG: type II toxin-antitoxin system HicA family toxin [Bacteroidetes bacterium]|nr:type II toxin-antitoxin system HicA family toxin [Bacteroidota bacterium]
MTQSLKNIPLKDFRNFLEFKGLKCIRTKGGHEMWSCTSLLRPITLQSHISPIPEFIIRNNLRTLGSNRSELLDFLNGVPGKK